MPISPVTVSYDIADLLGIDFDATRGRTSVFVTTNIPGGVLVDADSNQIRLDGAKGTVGTDGTGSVQLWPTNAATNPTAFQYWFTVDYIPRGKGRHEQKRLGPFSITTSANLADLIEEQAVPPTYLSQVTQQLDEKVAEAEVERIQAQSARAGAEAAEQSAQALVLSDLGTTDGQTRALIQNPASQTASALSASFAPIVDSPGPGVDCGPLLQAAFDAHRGVQLRPGQVYDLDTPVFNDAASNSARYVLHANGATIRLGNGLPKATLWDAGAVASARIAFFPSTKREGWNAATNVVDVSEAQSPTNAPSAPRLVILDAKFTDAGTGPSCVSFGGRTTSGGSGAVGLVRCIADGVEVGIAWTGYGDGNYADHCEWIGGGRIIYQRDSGDNLIVGWCKAYGGYIADLAGCQGFAIDGPVSGQIALASSMGVIRAGHQETDEIGSAVPWSVQIDRSQVTIEDYYSRLSNVDTKYTIRINDAASTPTGVASLVTIRNWRSLANFNPSQGDATKGASLRISSLNQGGRVRVENSFENVVRAGLSLSLSALIATSPDAAIQAALTDGQDYLNTGSWMLTYEAGRWRVNGLDYAEPPARRLAAPTLTLAADTLLSTTPGGLVPGGAYEYVAATKTAAGAYSALSGVVSASATATGALVLSVSNPSGPATIALWRKAAPGVASTPDRYIEVGLPTGSATWIDTGANLNGRAWRTASVPIPDSVKANGCQYTFPRGVRKAANEVVNNTATLQNDDELCFPLAAGSTYAFEAVIQYDASTAGDAKFALAVPAGASLVVAQIGSFTAATGNSGSITVAAGSTSGTPAANMGGAGIGTRLGAHIRGTVQTGASPGLLQLQWAQANADPTDLTVYAGSLLRAERIAA